MRTQNWRWKQNGLPLYPLRASCMPRRFSLRRVQMRIRWARFKKCQVYEIELLTQSSSPCNNRPQAPRRFYQLMHSLRSHRAEAQTWPPKATTAWFNQTRCLITKEFSNSSIAINQRTFSIRKQCKAKTWFQITWTAPSTVKHQCKLNLFRATGTKMRWICRSKCSLPDASKAWNWMPSALWARASIMWATITKARISNPRLAITQWTPK